MFDDVAHLTLVLLKLPTISFCLIDLLRAFVCFSFVCTIFELVVFSNLRGLIGLTVPFLSSRSATFGLNLYFDNLWQNDHLDHIYNNRFQYNNSLLYNGCFVGILRIE